MLAFNDRKPILYQEENIKIWKSKDQDDKKKYS
jgi:hypothetical protein